MARAQALEPALDHKKRRVRQAARRAVLLSSEEELNELHRSGALEWVTVALAHLLLVPGSVDEAFKRREDARAGQLAEPVPVEAEDSGGNKHTC